MFHWITKNPRLPCTLAGIAMFSLGTGLTFSQAPAPLSPAQFDPSDVYFQGYMAARTGEQLEAKGDFVGAAAKLKKAGEMFTAVRRYYPAWKPDMVAGRSAMTSEAEIRVHPKADEQRRKNQNAVAELEGGVKQSGTFIDPAQGVVPLTPSILEVDPLTTRKLAAAQVEVKRLKEIAKSNANFETDASRNESRVRDMARQRDLAEAQLKAAEAGASRNESRIRDTARQRDLAEAQLKAAEGDASRNESRIRDTALQQDLAKSQLNAAEAEVRSLRAELASKPAESEMKALSRRISSLEQEREAMGRALQQSRTEQKDALDKITNLTTELQATQQKYSNLERDLKSERFTSNEVVAGQRSQLKALQNELDQKNVELGKANDLIGSLRKELEESHDSFSQLRTERDALLLERDQMSALLKLNEDGRIQDLIQQNMGLAKNLREANDKVELLNRDNNATKDALTEAKRDLTMTKIQINRLHQEKREQDARLAEMEKRLKEEESALSSGKASSDPTEVAMLRDFIQRQLRVQERRRQARDLLVEAVKDMGTKDERIKQAIKLFDAQEIPLSPEEERLVAGGKVDGEFISPFAQDRATVGRNTVELNRDIAIYERTAEKSFLAGRFLPTRELFQMIVEQHPGHIPALCKLGVVDLKLNEPTAAVDAFRRAVELDPNNPYAHRMLGYSFLMLGDFKSAEASVKEAVALSPDDALSHSLLGAICENLGRPRDAEGYYKAAIFADPIPSEPYFNLARLCAKAKRLEDARNYYQQSLERGALPDPALEERLAQK